MPVTRQRIAQEIAHDLRSVERLLDQTLEAAGALAARLPAARLEAGIAATVGQSAFEHSGASFAHLIQARAGLIALHEELAGVGEKLGLEVHASGDLWKLPAALRIVSSERRAA